MPSNSAPPFTNSFQTRSSVLNLYNLQPGMAPPKTKGGKKKKKNPSSLKNRSRPLSRETKWVGSLKIAVSAPFSSQFPLCGHKASTILMFRLRESYVHV